MHCIGTHHLRRFELLAPHRRVVFTVEEQCQGTIASVDAHLVLYNSIADQMLFLLDSTEIGTEAFGIAVCFVPSQDGIEASFPSYAYQLFSTVVVYSEARNNTNLMQRKTLLIFPLKSGDYQLQVLQSQSWVPIFNSIQTAAEATAKARREHSQKLVAAINRRECTKPSQISVAFPPFTFLVENSLTNMNESWALS